jgi:hypothetical protein
MAARESRFSAAAVAEVATGAALRRLLRGRSWEAITREIAWRATDACACDVELVDALTTLADDCFSELVERVEFQVDQAVEKSWSEYVRRWPHDYEGAERFAVLEARGLAEHLLAVAYENAYLQVAEVARAREHGARLRNRRLAGPFRHRREGRAIAPLPALVVDDLARSDVLL